MVVVVPVVKVVRGGGAKEDDVFDASLEDGA
jgi:hypothetical protein